MALEVLQAFPCFSKRWEKRLHFGIEKKEKLIIANALPKALEDAIMMPLHKYNGRYYSSAEITGLIHTVFAIEKSKNNVSRYFNQNFHPFCEIKRYEETNRFRLSQTGKAHALWLCKKSIARKLMTALDRPLQ